MILVFCSVNLKIPYDVDKYVHCPRAVEDAPSVEDTVKDPAECQTV